MRFGLDRMRSHIQLHDTQNGFRKDRRCCDHAATIHDIIRGAVRKKRNLYIATFDFSKAFDNVYIPRLLRKLQNKGVPEYLIAIIEMMYTNCY